MFVIIGVVVVGIAVIFIGFRFVIQQLSTAPSTLGHTDGKFSLCPDQPNCVSSQAEETSEHYIAPISYQGEVETVQTTMLTILSSLPSAQIETNQSDYIHIKTNSPFIGYVDDTEFYFDETAQVIHVRAAARLGYSDLGKNRARVEEIRQKFNRIVN